MFLIQKKGERHFNKKRMFTDKKDAFRREMKWKQRICVEVQRRCDAQCNL